MAPIGQRLSRFEGRRFAWTVGSTFAALGALLWWRGSGTVAAAFLGLGGALGMAGLLVPGTLGPVHRAWMGGARLLSRVTTPVFLGVMYFAVITPVGFLRRTFGGNPLVHRLRDGSYFIARPPGKRRSDLDRQF